jgi:hypothetical protein
VVPVLLRSKRVCSSSWVPTLGFAFLKIEGASRGDLLDAFFEGDGEGSQVGYYEDGMKEIPVGTKRLKIKHTASSGQPVTVDLVHGE